MTDSTRIPAYPEPTTIERPAGVADPRPDGCPECGRRDNAPISARWTLDGGGYYSTYRCTCGHRWWTGWATEPAEVTHG